MQLILLRPERSGLTFCVPIQILTMNRILSVVVTLTVFTSCTNKMFPDKTLGQKTSQSSSGGVKYPDGSIHYPDGSIRTSDGMVWPAKSSGAKSNTTIRSSTTKTSTSRTGTIADDPNVTVVRRSSSSSSTASKSIPANTSGSKTVVKKSTKSSTRTQPDNVDVVTAGGNDSYDNHFPETTNESTGAVVKEPAGVNTSARKDASGRHARKRGDTRFRYK
jgi:hypothetical protein